MSAGRLALALVFAAMVAVALMSARGAGRSDASSAAGPVAFVGVDVDPTGNGDNGPLGVTNTCVGVSVGGEFTIDLVVKGIPPFVDDGDGEASGTPPDAGGLVGFDFELNYDRDVIQISEALTEAHFDRILAAGLDSGPLVPVFETAEAANVDGMLQVSNFDFSTVTASVEAGDGVFVSLKFEAVGAGESELSFTSGQPHPLLVFDGANSVYDVTSVGAGSVVVGGGGSGPCGDDDDDGVVNDLDECPATPSGSSVDANGCRAMDVDADFDGACNPGESSPSWCSGQDNCPTVANAGQANDDGDSWGNACDNCPATSTVWLVPVDDGDCDGFSASQETSMTTNPGLACGFTTAGAASPNWPPDLFGSNSINIQDVNALKPVFGTSVPPTSARYNLFPGGSINIQDVNALKPFFTLTCTP